jgi:hypothetical protein
MGVAMMPRKLSLMTALVLAVWLCLGAAAFAGDTLQFTPVGVYWNTACSSSGYVTLCGKQAKDDWYFIVKNNSDKTITAGSVVYVLLVDTTKLNYVLTGATLDLFKKARVSADCAAFTPAPPDHIGALGPGACAFMGSAGGTNSIEWADVPIFDYKYLSQEGIIRAGVRIDWKVSGSGGFSDSGSYIYYPEILSK